MAFGISKGRISPIAVDFGADALKVLQIVPGSPTQVVVAATRAVPEDARLDQNARLAFMEEALREMLRDLPFKGKRASCAIPGFQMLIHNFMLPRCDRDDINGMVDLTLRERLGIDPSRMIIRNFHAVDHHRRGEPRTDVICLAAQRELVMKYLQLAGRCKLEVAGMHPEPVAAVKALEPEAGQSVGTQCIVDLGCGTTKVMVARDGRMTLAKTIHVGGEQRIRKIVKKEGLAFAEARSARIEQTRHALVGAGAGTGAGDAPNADAGGATEDAVPADSLAETLMDEIRAVRRHHRGRFPEAAISSVLFCGGEANDAVVRSQLAGCFGVGCELADPFRDADFGDARVEIPEFEPGRPMPGWVVAAGLCVADANL